MGKAAAQVTTIGACAAVLPGYSMGSAMEHNPEGTHQVILSRHLRLGVPYEYQPADEFRITPGGRDATRYGVKPGDVLFMSRGTRNLAWEIGRVPEPSLAPVSFYILRPGPGVTPGYLAWYFNHPRAQAAIAQIRTGAGTATGLVSIPNRYMHSPNEVVSLSDLENAARLIAEFVHTITAESDFRP